MSALLFPPLFLEPQFQVRQISYLLKFTETFVYLIFPKPISYLWTANFSCYALLSSILYSLLLDTLKICPVAPMNPLSAVSNTVTTLDPFTLYLTLTDSESHFVTSVKIVHFTPRYSLCWKGIELPCFVFL